MADPLYLVACCARKTSFTAPAEVLYTSDLFRKSRNYVQGQGGQWFILSAKYGLVHPTDVISPYDMTLQAMSPVLRRDWAGTVIARLQTMPLTDRPMIFLAGALYREHLVPWAGDRTQIPMQGMGIGQQKAWLKANTPGWIG